MEAVLSSLYSPGVSAILKGGLGAMIAFLVRLCQTHRIGEFFLEIFPEIFGKIEINLRKLFAEIF